ncbi:MAG: tetratricopeptide repeat protein [Planctomycetaceae bacterium]|nr:tetratricopeptide repeat protein [Planctomycetaceae bacterium]
MSPGTTWNTSKQQADGPLADYQGIKEAADCCAVAGDLERARGLYRQALELEPHRADSYAGLGVVALAEGRPYEAQGYFELARDLDRNCTEACSGLAMIYQDRKEYRQAFAMYLRCLEIDGDNLMALLGLFQTSCQMGTFAMIVHYLKVYLSRHNDDAAVLFCLATLYAREGSLAAAREAAMKVLSLQPQNAEAAALLQRIEQTLSSRAADDHDARQ